MESKQLKWMVLICVMLLSTSALAFDILEYFPDFHEKAVVYQSISAKGTSENYGDTGRIDELNELLMSAVDEQDKTATDYYVLGNMLFGGYPELSIKFMKKAEQLSPDNPAIHFERAIQEHRRDNCVEAVKYYDRFFESDFGATHATARARGAECYLKTGRYSDAVDSWIAADHGENHISIEKAIFSMYEGEPYYSRRLKLLNKIIKDNQSDLFPELISMDLNWQHDWWNIDVNEKHLKSDMALASKMLSVDEYQKLVVMTHLEKKDLSKDDMLKLLDEANLWNDSSALPESDVLMYHMIFYLSKEGVVKTDELLRRFESDLRKRVFNENEHTKNLDILAFIYSETDEDKMKEIDRLGWKKYQLPNYAINLLLTEKDEPEFDSLLKEIADDFPYEPQIALLMLQRNKDKGKETALMANMVIGEYKNVQNRFNSYQLKNYMYSLAKQIKHRVYKDRMNQD